MLQDRQCYKIDRVFYRRVKGNRERGNNQSENRQRGVVVVGSRGLGFERRGKEMSREERRSENRG